jgi:hypothetical protein
MPTETRLQYRDSPEQQPKKKSQAIKKGTLRNKKTFRATRYCEESLPTHPTHTLDFFAFPRSRRQRLSIKALLRRYYGAIQALARRYSGAIQALLSGY